MIRVAILCCSLWWPLAGQAVIETYEFDSEELRRRYLTLSAELRCPKCQNQNIADSNAPIAADLRAQLHRQLHAGRSDDEIAAYMVGRYGEFVLYRPRWSAQTAVLWLAPALLMLSAILAVALILRRSVAGKSEVLADTDKRRLAELLEGGVQDE